MISCEVEIFGRLYKIKAEKEEDIRLYADFLNKRLSIVEKQIKTIDDHVIFSLTGMNIAEEFFNLKKENERLKNELKQLNEKTAKFIIENNI